MSTVAESKAQVSGVTVLTSDAVLEHWQGHRRLTRRVIEAFPEDKFYTYSIGGMRPFAALVMEMMGLASPGIRGIVSGVWQGSKELPADSQSPAPATKAEVLRIWDAITDELNEQWPKITPQRFNEVDAAYGQYEGTIHSLIFYLIDNEIHHRAQAYVYLRSLGVEPPAFWDRS